MPAAVQLLQHWLNFAGGLCILCLHLRGPSGTDYRAAHTLLPRVRINFALARLLLCY